MPLVHRILITLRTLMEEDPQPSYSRKRKPNGSNRNNRSSKTTAMVLTFRDLFRSGGLNVILDEMDVGRRPSRRNSRSQSVNNKTNDCCVPKAVLCSTSHPRHDTDSRVILRDQVAPVMTPPCKPACYVEDETVPLLHEEVAVVPCTDLVVSQIPFHPSRFFSNLPLIARRRNKKKENLTVSLNPRDESKTVETLRKVLKWSPRKQNSATFAVSLPVEEEKHLALAVVENAVNTVKEEQLRKKKKRKFFWMKSY